MTITKQAIETMSYVDFIAFISESNRCPGGKQTIRTIAQNTFIDNASRVLDIGSNTGFTSFEFAHLLKCQVYGIDTNRACVNEATRQLRLDTPETQKNVLFLVGSAYEIPFPDNTFDLVVTGGATSFMERKQSAISEYMRVVKPWGFISVTQLFYTTRPPQRLLRRVSNAIGVRIEPYQEEDWLAIFMKRDRLLELYYYESHGLSSRPREAVAEYIEYFRNKPQLALYSSDIKEAIITKWRGYLEIFNENHNYLGYFIALFRKGLYVEEPELFNQQGH